MSQKKKGGILMTSPNQRTIISNKTKVEMSSGKSRPYLIAYIDIIENASQKLSGNAFKLYIYLLSNNVNFQFGFSPKDVAKRYGCSADTIRDAFLILIKEGFLTLENGSKTKYIFTDIPLIKPLVLPNSVADNLEKKDFIDIETNKKYSLTYKELLIACENNIQLANDL